MAARIPAFGRAEDDAGSAADRASVSWYRQRLASYVPEPVKRPLRGVRRRIVRVRDSVGSRAAVLAAALPKPPEPRVEGISQRLLEAKRTELAAARHFGRHDLAAMEALLERADDVVTVGEAFRRRDAWPERFVA